MRCKTQGRIKRSQELEWFHSHLQEALLCLFVFAFATSSLPWQEQIRTPRRATGGGQAAKAAVWGSLQGLTPSCKSRTLNKKRGSHEVKPGYAPRILTILGTLPFSWCSGAWQVGKMFTVTFWCECTVCAFPWCCIQNYARWKHAGVNALWQVSNTSVVGHTRCCRAPMGGFGGAPWRKQLEIERDLVVICRKQMKEEWVPDGFGTPGRNK